VNYATPAAFRMALEARLAADLDLEAKTIDHAMKDLRAFWALVRSTEET
jgi:hypothetical protein